MQTKKHTTDKGHIVAKLNDKLSVKRHKTYADNTCKACNYVELVWFFAINYPHHKRHKHTISCRQKGIFARCCVQKTHRLKNICQCKTNADQSALPKIRFVEQPPFFKKDNAQQQSCRQKTK